MTRNLDQAPDVIVLATRAFSKALFGGAQYRVEVGAAIYENEVVSTADLAEELGLSRQSVNQELRLLERVGLLRREPSGSSRNVYLRKQDSDYWKFCAEAARGAVDRLRGAQPF
jgi:predicted transcriptional regulator